ncbi:MAG: hypothetical protein AAGA17_00135 [Actinomycetota bacterium]
MRARARQPSGGANDLRASLQLAGAIGISTQSQMQVPSSAWTSGVVIARSAKLDGSRWTEAELAGLQVRLHAGLQGGLEVADIDGEIEYEDEPTTSSVELTTPASALVSWAFSDPDDGANTSERARVIIVADGTLDASSNAAGTAGFDPLTAAAIVYDSGELVGNLRSHATGAKLGGGNYWAYVRAAKVWTIDTDTWWSPWAASALTPVIEAVAKAPEIVAATVAAGTPNHVDLQIRQAGNIFRLDRSLDAQLENPTNATISNGETTDAVVGTEHSSFTPTTGSTARAEIDSTDLLQASADVWSVGETFSASLWVRHTTLSQFKFFILEMVISELGGGTLATVTGNVTAVETEWRQVSITTTLPALVGSVGWSFALAVEVSSSGGIEFLLDAPCIQLGSDPAWSPGLSFIDLSTDWVAELQRSDDGQRWTTVPGSTTFDFAHLGVETLTDKGSAGRASAQYRARTRPSPAGSAADGLDSDWGQAFAISPTGALDRWDLWDLTTDTQLEIKARRHPVSSADRHHTFEPIGREEGITHSEVERGDMATLTVRVYSKADYDALLAMLGSGRTLRLRNHLGEAWWIRVNRSNNRDQVRARADDPDWSTAHFHDVTFAWRQAAPPS